MSAEVFVISKKCFLLFQKAGFPQYLKKLKSAKSMNVQAS